MKIKKIYFFFIILLILTLPFKLISNENEDTLILKKQILDKFRKIPLKILNLKLCESVQSYRNYEELYNNEIITGEDVYIYYEIEGLYTIDYGDYLNYSISHDISIYTYNKKLIKTFKNCLNIEKNTEGIIVEFPIIQSMRLGDFPEGTYFLKITLYDKLKNQKAESRIKFKVITGDE